MGMGTCCEIDPTKCYGAQSSGTYTCAAGTSLPAANLAKVGTTIELCCTATPAPTASPAPTAAANYTCASFPCPPTPAVAPAVGAASGAQQFAIEASVMLVAAMLTFSAV